MIAWLLVIAGMLCILVPACLMGRDIRGKGGDGPSGGRTDLPRSNVRVIHPPRDV